MQKAFTDVGTAYKNLQIAFTELNPNLLHPIADSRISQAHQQVMQILQQTGQVLLSSPKLNVAAASAISMPARTLSTIQTAALELITKTKPLAVRSGEREVVGTFLKQQSEAYITWSKQLNQLLPSFQKGAGNAFADNIISLYKREIAAYSTN